MINEVFYYDENYKEKAEWCRRNNCFISEVFPDEKGRRFVIKQIEPIKEAELIRAAREEECFHVVNRGQVWYEMLTNSQMEELKKWYQAWLDAPATKIMPVKPLWLK